MPAREIKVEIVGDASSFTKASDAVSREAGQMSSTFDRLQKDANEASRGIDKTSSSLKDAGEAGGDMESSFRGVLDVTGAVGEQFGVALPAGLQTGLQGITDIGGGIESFIRGAPGFLAAAVSMTTAIWAQVTALTAQAVAFAVANAPIIAIIAAIALLGVGIVLLVKYWDDLVAKFPVLQVALDAVKAKFEEFTGWLTGTLVPAIMGIADKFTEGAQKIVSAIQTGFAPIKAILETYVNAWKLVIEAVWTQIQIYVETAIGVIQGVIDVAMGLITGDWDRAWSGIKQIVDSIWQGIKATVENGIGLIKGLGGLMLEAGSTLMQALKSGLMDIWHTQIVPFVVGLPGEILRLISNLGSVMYNAGVEGMKSLFSGIKNQFASGIGEVKSMINPANWGWRSPLDVSMAYEGREGGVAFVEGIWDAIQEKWIPKAAAFQALARDTFTDVAATTGLLPGGTSWGGAGNPGALNGMPDWIGGTSIAATGQAALLPQYLGGGQWQTMPSAAGAHQVGETMGFGTNKVTWTGTQWTQTGAEAYDASAKYRGGNYYGIGNDPVNGALPLTGPQVINLVVDGQVLAQVVNKQNEKQL